MFASALALKTYSTMITFKPLLLIILIRLVRILGELYNYSVVSAPVIYELLYTVINYGHLKETKGDEVKKALSVGEAPHR